VVGKKKGGNSSSYVRLKAGDLRLKKPKCIVPKCKNTPSRNTPEGDLVCRTHLARRNMFGAVDAPSPTTSSVGRGTQYKNGFNIVSSRQEMEALTVENRSESKEIHNKMYKRRRYSGVMKKKQGDPSGNNNLSRAYKDFKKDGGSFE
tara:strand:+ start:261 stop:701 length:441 start_codon:yes stop_codon:yes gene_type:complete